jgi:hypothetical protein
MPSVANGRWLREAFFVLADRYPTHPLAVDRSRWLLMHQASSEVRRRYELGQFVVITDERCGTPGVPVKPMGPMGPKGAKNLPEVPAFERLPNDADDCSSQWSGRCPKVAAGLPRNSNNV